MPPKQWNLAYKALDHNLFCKHNKTYGFAVSTGEVCELPQKHNAVLSAIPSIFTLLEDIVADLPHTIEENELAEILRDLKETGFIDSFDEHIHPISSINLFLSTFCNLNCVYCYGGEGRASDLAGGSYGMKQELMSLEMGKKAVDYLLKTSVLRSDHSSGGINFFGGEPLLNMEVLRGVCEYAEEQSYKFGLQPPSYSITTNGLLIDEAFISLCKKHHISVQVSFDGTPEAQNTMRPKSGGQPSYPELEQALQLLKKHHLPIRIRATISTKNIALMDSIEHLESIGVDQVHYAIAIGQDTGLYALDERDVDMLTDAFEKVAEYTIERIKTAKRFVRCNNLFAMMGQLQKKNIKKYACGAGIGLASLSPEGEFHVCHRFAGMTDFSFGHIDNGIDFRRRLQLIELMNIKSHKECATCWAKNICGGECHYSNYDTTGHIEIPNHQMCKFHQSLARTTIYMSSEIRQFDEEMYFKCIEQGR